MQSEIARASFQDRFCWVYHCPPEQFSTRVFQLCLYPQARLFAKTARPDLPGLFDWDFGCIKSVAGAGSLSQVQAEIDLHRYHQPPAGMLKGLLRIRISGRRLSGLARDVFMAEGETGNSEQGRQGQATLAH